MSENAFFSYVNTALLSGDKRWWTVTQFGDWVLAVTFKISEHRIKSHHSRPAWDSIIVPCNHPASNLLLAAPLRFCTMYFSNVWMRFHPLHVAYRTLPDDLRNAEHSSVHQVGTLNDFAI